MDFTVSVSNEMDKLATKRSMKKPGMLWGRHEILSGRSSHKRMQKQTSVPTM